MCRMGEKLHLFMAMPMIMMIKITAFFEEDQRVVCVHFVATGQRGIIDSIKFYQTPTLSTSH